MIFKLLLCDKRGPQILLNYDNMMKRWRRDVYHVGRYSGARIQRIQ